MKLALRAHQARWVLPVQLVAALIGSLFGDLHLAVPSFTGTGTLPVTVLAALAAAIVLAPAMSAAWPSDRTTPVRRAAVVTTAVMSLYVVAVALWCVILQTIFPSSSAISYLGTFGWLLGIQLLVAVLASHFYQGLGPAFYVMLCALIGRAGAEPRFWAWPLADVPIGQSLGFGFGLLLLSMLSLLLMGLRGKSENIKGSA